MALKSLPDVRELKLARNNLLIRLSEAKTLFGADSAGYEELTVYGAVKGLRLSIRTERKKRRSAA